MNLTDVAILERFRSSFDLLPITEMTAVDAALLPEPFHGDPMDRLIVAHARVEGRTLITADRLILDAKVCKAVW